MNSLENELVGALIGFGATVTDAMNAEPGFIPCGNPAAMVSKGLLLINSDASEEALTKQVALTKNFIAHVSEHHGGTPHPVADATTLNAEQLALLDELKTVAASMQKVEEHHPEVFNWVYRSLASLEPNSSEDFAKLSGRAEKMKAHAASLA